MKVKFIGKTEFLVLTNGKIYDVMSVEKGFYKIIVDDSGEDYLYPPTFEVVYTMSQIAGFYIHFQERGGTDLIVVNITPTGLTVDGHAGYAKTGNDIICTAVSVLTQNLVNSVISAYGRIKVL